MVLHLGAPIRSARRRLAPLAGLAIVSLLASSCAKQLPTAPRMTALQKPGVAHSAVANDDVPNQVVVTLAPGANPAQIASDYSATLLGVCQGIALLRPTDNPDNLTLRLRTDSRVLGSERNRWLQTAEARQQSYAFDDGHGSLANCVAQAATRTINLDQAHLAGAGQGVLVAIVDTGIDPTHPLFAGRIAGGWDFVDNDADPTDARAYIDEDGDGVVDEAFGHGTHVAGIVSLVAPQARLLIVRVLDSEGRGTLANVAAGIRWANLHGAKIINLSLGTLTPSCSIQLALDEADSHGVLCTAAAGNWGAETPVEYPAEYSDAVAVAAVDANDQPASFTSYGSYIALCAPGIGIRSAYPGGGYELWSGTSMSTPFVSGTAALISSLHPDWNGEQIMQRITSTAQGLNGVSIAQLGKLGAGGLDAGAALVADTQAPNDDGGSTDDVRRPN